MTELPNESSARSKRLRALLLALASGAIAFGGALTTAFLWRNPDVWENGAARPVVFRVQSRSMEPSFRGPRFVWTCPKCRASFATSLDVAASIESFSRSELVAADGVSGATERLRDGSNADSEEARRALAKTRFLSCPECGYDQVPASEPRFEDGATINAESRDVTAATPGLLERVKRAWRRETDPQFRAEEAESRKPKRWDVVVFFDAMRRLTLKRVVGLPGERISVVNGDVAIDDKPSPREFQRTLEMAAPIKSVEFRRSDERVDVVHVTRVWRGEASESRATAISNESETPCLNGSNVAGVELVRDFLLNFHWLTADGATTRFAVLVRRPDAAFLLSYDETTRRVTSRKKTLYAGVASSGKPFEALSESDFVNETGEAVDLDEPVAKDARFTVATIDGELLFAVDGRVAARFSTGDFDSTTTAAISQPFTILGAVARASDLALYRDVHYSNASEPLRPQENDERFETLNGRVTRAPQGRYFVLGDNSPASLDSRFGAVGTIDSSDVLYVLP